MLSCLQRDAKHGVDMKRTGYKMRFKRIKGVRGYKSATMKLKAWFGAGL